MNSLWERRRLRHSQPRQMNRDLQGNLLKIYQLTKKTSEPVTGEQTEETLPRQVSTSAFWEEPMPSSDVSIAPLPWEDNFESVSPESASSETSDSLTEESHQSSESLAESDAAASAFSFNTVEKDSSSFAPFPWEDHADSPDISISEQVQPSEVELTNQPLTTEEREGEDPLDDLLSEPADNVQETDVHVVDSANEMTPSHQQVDAEVSIGEHEPLSDSIDVHELDLHTPTVSDDTEPVESLSQDSEAFVSSTEEPPLLDERTEPIGELVAELPGSMVTSEGLSGPDSILDGGNDRVGDHVESDIQEVEEKPLEQAAAEAMAALQGDPESSFSSFGQPGTLELKELPEENVIQAAEEESLAQAATESLTTFEDGLSLPVPSPEESQVRSEIAEGVELAMDLPSETHASDEIPSEQSEEISSQLEELVAAPLIEEIGEPVVQTEEGQIGRPLVLDSDSTTMASDEVLAQHEQEETGAVAELETSNIGNQVEDESVENYFAFDGDPSIEVSEEVLVPQKQAEDVVSEVAEEEVPIPLSPWDPPEETAQAPSYVEEPVQEPSTFASGIQFAQSDERLDVEEVHASIPATPEDRPRYDLQARADMDIAYPEAEDAPIQEQEEAAELSQRERLQTARSSGPMWAVAQTQEGLSEKAQHKPLFPTAHKLKIKIRNFTQGVISTVRTISILSLLVSIGIGLIGFVTVGILSIIWVAVEERPNEPFHNMMKGPNLSRLDSERNGYHVLNKLGAKSTLYPLGFQPQDKNGKGHVEVSDRSLETSGVFTTLAGWYQVSNPVSEFQAQRSQIKGWSSQYGSDLSKYHQWSKKSFEDIGFRSIEGPDEKQIVSVHQLFIAEGFSQNISRGLDRLAADLEAWRYALGQAKTLRIKMLALEVIKDDLVILSALLGDPHLDRNLLPALTRLGRPISQNERSLRWPMQNQFVLEVDQIKTYMNSQSFPNRPLYQKAMTFLPLPQQKVFNVHAVFYERLIKHDATLHLEGDPRKGIPLRYPLANTPAESLSDYFNNPIDNLVMTQSKVDWREITGRLIELEARLRLTTLQARIRRPPEVHDPISRIARAGQDFFDPFTGYTMLLNASKTRLYSVGSDGADNDGDLQQDVAVPLFRK